MRKTNKFGFTLIELLIVIALLGALAVGLLATVDPFEQLKKGRDTSTRNTASEFHNAVIRYYAQRGNFPTGLSSGVNTTLDQLGSAITAMAEAGELKSEFLDLAGTGNLARIHAIVPNNEKIIVCFNPESKAFRNDQNAKFNSTGGLDTANCPSPTSQNCYVCFE